MDTSFSSTDLTLDLQDFSQRILEPAMAQLAAHVEADAFNMLDDVYQVEDRSGSAVQFSNVLNTRKKLRDALAPMDNNKFILDTQANVDLVDALKGLFQDSTQIAKQYREGMIGRTANFEFFENTLIKSHTVGSQDGNYQTKGGDQTGSTLNIDTGTGTIKKGDVFTIAGVNRVHPESKDDTGELQQFVVTSDEDTGGDVTINISPSIVASGARQNVTNAAGDNKALTFVGSASTAHNRSVAFHPDAFTFATADLTMPDGVHFAARETYDGLSMRIVRQYDVNNDTFPCRIDILYGYKTIRPELAAILAAN